MSQTIRQNRQIRLGWWTASSAAMHPPHPVISHDNELRYDIAISSYQTNLVGRLQTEQVQIAKEIIVQRKELQIQLGQCKTAISVILRRHNALIPQDLQRHVKKKSSFSTVSSPAQSGTMASR